MPDCTDPQRIREFLQLLRHRIDDNIAANINDSPDCLAYFKATVHPEWQKRRNVLDHCSQYEHQLRAEAEKNALPNTSVSEEDLRQNPYALRNVVAQIDRQFATCDAMRLWVSTEQGVELIVQDQTINVFRKKCGYFDYPVVLLLAPQ